MERFWSKVEKTETCWLWKGSCGRKGYGQFKLNGKMRKAHRVAWELINGAIPEGISILHKCDVPACVRPDHLFAGTEKDNTNDAISKGRKFDSEHQANAAKTRWSRIPKDQRNTNLIGKKRGIKNES